MVNQSLKPQGCNIAVLSTPDRYPQGFVFSRPLPEIAVKADGSYAASMRAGLLVECDLPESVTGLTTFSPNRVQAVIGFAYSKVEANDEPGGFGLGSLGSFTSGAFIDVPPITVSVPLPATITTDLSPLTAPAPATPSTAAAVPAPSPKTRIIATFHPLGSSTRWLALVLGLVAFAALTHLGIVRLRQAFTG